MKFTTTNKNLVIAALTLGIFICLSLIVVAENSPAVLVTDFHFDPATHSISNGSNSLSIGKGDSFNYLVRYDLGTANNNQIRIVIPEGISLVNADPNPTIQSNYILTYLGAVNEKDGVSIINLNLKADKNLNEGDVTIPTFVQPNDPNIYSPIAYSNTQLTIKQSTAAAPSSGRSLFNISFSTWILFAIIFILAVLLIAFLLLNSILTVPSLYRAPSAVIPASDRKGKTAVFGFSFGLRGNEPGLSNEVMAAVIKNQFSDAVISVQWEIGTALKRLGINPDHEITENLSTPGRYLDTEEVAKQMAQFISNQEGITNYQVIAQDEHMPRVIKTLKKFGINAKPGCANIPYDPQSSQIWTRSPLLFKFRELLGYPFYLLKGVV